MQGAGATKPSGSLGLTVIKKDAWVPEWLRHFNPRSDFGRYIRTVARRLPEDVARELIDRVAGLAFIETSLRLVYLPLNQPAVDLGIVSRKKFTSSAATFIAARMSGVSAANIANFNFHGLGTGVAAESNANTALGTELTTEYAVNNTRPTGTQSTPGSTNIYQTVGMNTLDAAGPTAITEHGIFDQASNAGGTLLDRSVFSAVNLMNGDGLQSTYQFTITPEA